MDPLKFARKLRDAEYDIRDFDMLGSDEQKYRDLLSVITKLNNLKRELQGKTNA